MHQRTTVTKVSLKGYTHELPIEEQRASVEMAYIIEHRDDEEVLHSAPEHSVKFKGVFAHPDLVAAMSELRPHLCYLMEFVPFLEQEKLFKNGKIEKVFADIPQELPQFHVTGITITGTADHPGIVLTGFKVLVDGTKQNLVTANFLYEEDQSPYLFRDRLSVAIEHVLGEARLVVEQRKFRPDEQFEFDFPDHAPNEGGGFIAEPA